MSWPTEAEHLIEPARLRPNHSMPPRRGEEMTGARITGLARQHPLALEKAAARLTVAGRHEATHEPLAGLATPVS